MWGLLQEPGDTEKWKICDFYDNWFIDPDEVILSELFLTFLRFIRFQVRGTGKRTNPKK